MKQLKLITKLRGLIVLALALVFSGNAWAETVTESVTLHPTGVATNGTSNAYNTSNAYAASSNTTYAYILKSGYIYYTFDTPTLPAGATITSVACKVGAYKTGSLTGTAQLYDGTTAMGSAATISGTNSGSTTTISSTGTWSTSNIGNLVLRFNASYSGGSNRYLYVGGADLTINYTYEDGYSVTLPTSVTGGSVTTTSTTSGLSGGEQITLTVTPDDGYDLSTLTVAGETVTPTANADGTYSYTFTMPTSDVTVAATFAVKTYKFVLKTSGSIDTSKKYLIVYQDGNDATTASPMNSSFTSAYVDNVGYCATVGSTLNITSNAIETTASNAFTFEGTEGDYSIKNYAGTYFGSTSSSVWFAVSNSGISHTVTFSGNNVVLTCNSRYLGYQSSCGGTTTPGYCYLTSSSNNVYLYEESGSITPVTGVNVFVTPGNTKSPFTKNNAYTGTITYTSDNTSIASVTSNGVVTGNQVGVAHITATFNDEVEGYTTGSVTVAVNVYTAANPNYKETTWSDEDEDNPTNVVYLLNKATGRYLATGGYWGTEGMLKTTGIPTTLVTSLSDASEGASVSTTMTQNGKNWGWVTGEMTSVSYKLGLYCDVSDDSKYKTYTHSFTFTNLGNGEFSIASDQMTSYSGSTYYLTQNGDGSETRNYIVTAKHYEADAIPDEARWFVLTRQNLIDDFANATASNAQPKEATFFINNSDFSREVAQSWTFSTTASDYTTGYIRIGNSLFASAGPTTSVNGTTTYIEDETTAIGSGTSYDGNGDGYKLVSDDLPYVGSDLTVGTSVYYNLPYGGFYNCRILGESGTVKQSFKVEKSGWYTVAIEGYVYNPSGANGVATFYAGKQGVTTQGDTYKEVAFDSNTFETMTDGGITLYNKGNNSKYHKTLTVYLSAGDAENEIAADVFEIGVKLTGGTFKSATLANTSSFAEFDRVRITYTGDPDYNILLDEKNDGTETYNGYNYINAQVYNVTGKTARTLYLKRKFVTGQWNSLVLPVTIGTAQLKAAFGDDLVLAEFNKAENNWIYFKQVPLTDGQTAIEPGKCYLIKPTTINNQITSGTKSVTLARATNNNISATATSASPIITITQVELTSDVQQNPSAQPNTPFVPTTDTDLSGQGVAGLKWMGTYFRIGTAGAVNDDGGIGYGSYALNAGDEGKWYRWVDKEKYLGVDGLRCWIGNVDKTGGDNPAKLITVIDDEISYSTDIEGVYSEQPEAISDNRVYNINGQFVGTSENINKLPKGIYISNGKKYIVK